MDFINKIKNKLKDRKVFANVSWILFQNVYTMLLSMILTGIVARHYGTSGYGIINLGLSYVSLFSFIAVYGTNHIIVNDLANKKYQKGVVLGSNLFIRIILSIIALVISQIFALFLYNKTINIIILLFSINTIINCSDVIAYYAQVNLQNKSISIAKMISTTIFSILKLLCVLCNFNLIIFVITYLIENIIYSILLYLSYRRIKGDKKIEWKIDKEYTHNLLKKSKYYALSTLMVTLYLKIDQVMLGTFFKDKSVVGIYSAAVRISEIWTFVPLSIITAFKPIIFQSIEEDKNAYEENLQKLYNIVSLVCLVFVIGIIIFGKLGIFILYGDKYLSAYIPLIILTFGIWFGVLGNVHYIWMTCENKEKYSLLYSFIGSSINIILNILLIPKYNILGAAIATLASQICSNIISFLLIKTTRKKSLMLLKSLNPISGLKIILKRKDSIPNN